MTDADRRVAIERHWAASHGVDEAAEHAMDLLMMRSSNIHNRASGSTGDAISRASVGHHPARREFIVRSVRGSGNLWITELVITYDGKPYDTVSIMEFRGDHVALETQYFAEPFEAAAWRTQWAESGQRE